MAKVLGIGGVFLKAKDPTALRAWYRDVLGLDIQGWGGAILPNEAGSFGVFTLHKQDTDYYKPSTRDFMINLRVEDLDGLLAKLRESGANVLERGERTEHGAFGYVLDPEGTLLELWQPPPEKA